MASETSALDLIGLPGGVSTRGARSLRESLRSLLRFHATLRGWPARLEAPAATPIVSIHSRGRLVGCAIFRGRARPGQRLARAFLSAAANAAPGADLAAEVTYARRLRWVKDAASIEVGSEGVAFVGASGPVLLMPQVACEFGVDADGLVALLRDKAGDFAEGARLAAWTAARVAARTSNVEEDSARAAARSGATSADYAAAWLARLVGRDGAMTFAIDPVGRVLQPRGELHHARSAVAIEALARHGGHAAEVARARRFLGREIAAGLRGERVPDWPKDEAAVAGTLALAARAGLDELREPLLRLARGRALPQNAWHAAQVCHALGERAPAALWSRCLASLREAPFAPWTALAAKAMKDEAGYRQAAAAVARCIRTKHPHAGGAAVSSVPECGLTAVAAHALVGSAHARERELAFAFVRARQLLPFGVPAALDPTLALGAFAATPVNALLRGDIVGHALLALLAE